MRIGFQIERFDIRRGGAEVYVDRLARRLIALGHEVHLVARQIVAPPPGALGHLVARFDLPSTAAAVRALSFDVVVGTGRAGGMNVFQPHAGIAIENERALTDAIRSPSLRRALVAFSAVNPRARRMRALQREQFLQRDPTPRLVAVSRMVAGHIRQHFPAASDRIDVIPNGVDVGAFAPRELTPRRDPIRRRWGVGAADTLFVLIAHNLRLKGARELIEAFAQARRQKKSLILAIVGRGRPGGFRRLAKRLAVDDDIRWIGPLDDPRDAYAAADAYVHPTWYDACSLTVLEALASGLAVVTTRRNGASEFIEHGREGFLLDSPREIELLAGRLLALTERERRTVMGRAARMAAAANDEDLHVARMLDLFGRVAHQSPIAA